MTMPFPKHYGNLWQKLMCEYVFRPCKMRTFLHNAQNCTCLINNKYIWYFPSQFMMIQESNNHSYIGDYSQTRDYHSEDGHHGVVLRCFWWTCMFWYGQIIKMRGGIRISHCIEELPVAQMVAPQLVPLIYRYSFSVAFLIGGWPIYYVAML